jgi:hypothetical protein
MTSLSYADRAKKAQNIKSTTSPFHPLRSSSTPMVGDPSTTINVWSTRQPRIVQSHPSPTHQTSLSSDTLQNGAHRQRKEVSLNGLAPSQPDLNDDPFVVRVPPQQSRGLPSLVPPLPSIDDTDSWPEVGKLSSTGSNSHHSSPPIETPQRVDEDHKEGQAKKSPFFFILFMCA